MEFRRASQLRKPMQTLSQIIIDCKISFMHEVLRSDARDFLLSTIPFLPHVTHYFSALSSICAKFYLLLQKFIIND